MKRIKRRLSQTFSHIRKSQIVTNGDADAELEAHTIGEDVTWYSSPNNVMSSSMYVPHSNGVVQQPAAVGSRMCSSMTVTGSTFAVACDCPLNDLNESNANASAGANATSGAAALQNHSARPHGQKHDASSSAQPRIPRSSTALASSRNSVPVWDSQLPASMSGDLSLAIANHSTNAAQQSVAINGAAPELPHPHQHQNATSAKQHKDKEKDKDKEKRSLKFSFLRRSTMEKHSRSPHDSNGERIANSRAVAQSPPPNGFSPAKSSQTSNSASGSKRNSASISISSASNTYNCNNSNGNGSGKHGTFETSASSRAAALVSPIRQAQIQSQMQIQQQQQQQQLEADQRLRAQLTQGGKIGRALSVCVEDLPANRLSEIELGYDQQRSRNSVALPAPYNYNVVGNQHADLISPSHAPCCAQHPVGGSGSSQQPPSLTNAAQAKTIAVHQQNGTVALVKLRPKPVGDNHVPNGVISHYAGVQHSHNHNHRTPDEPVVYANSEALVNVNVNPPRHHSPIYANTLYETDGEQAVGGQVSKRFSLPVRYGSFHDGLRQPSAYLPPPPPPPPVSQLASNHGAELRAEPANFGMSMSMHEQLLTPERSPLRVSHSVLQSYSPHRVPIAESASQLRNAVVLRNALNAANGSQLNPNAQTLINGTENGHGTIGNSSRNLNKLSRREKRVSMYEMGYGKLESYLKLERLGEGTYATVFKGKSLLTNALVALKEIRLEHDEGAPCTAIREVSLLRQLKHANIVTLHDIIHTENALTLVFEYVGKDLKLYMEERRNLLHTHNIKLFLFQLLRGLSFCHQRNILHRDLKPQNLLISPRGELKLADFGLARAKSIPIKTYSHEVVTLWYRPPDILLGSTDYSTPIDMWGVGCILFEMATGRPMFPGTTVENQLNVIFRVLGTPSEATWPGIEQNEEFVRFHFTAYPAENIQKLAPRLDAIAVDLLLSFLRFVPTTRLGAEAAMRHRFFDALGPAVHDLRNTDSIMDVPGIMLKKDPGQLRGTAMGLSHAISVHHHANQLSAGGAYQLPHSHSQLMNLANAAPMPMPIPIPMPNTQLQLHAAAADAHLHQYQAVNVNGFSQKPIGAMQQSHSSVAKYDIRRQSMLA